jgi:hypothetical protein
MRHAAHVGEKRDLKEKYCMGTKHGWGIALKLVLAGFV